MSSLSASASIDVRETAGLGAVDLAVLAGLVMYGHVHHGGKPLAEPIAALETAVPFLVGWIGASLLAGVYASDVYRNPARTARLTAVCWIAAANVGLILRSSPYFDGGTAYPFGLVMTGTGLLVFVAWRVAYARVTRRRA